MKAVIVILVVLLILALVVGGAYVGRRNQMAIKREAVNAAWPRLTSCCSAARPHPQFGRNGEGLRSPEQTVFGAIAAARAALIGAKSPSDKIAANGQLDSA